MDNTINIIILLFLTTFVSICMTTEDKPQYEPVARACEKCTCHLVKDEAKIKHYVLDCSVRNMKHILAGWPSEFGDNHTGSEITVSFSGNQIQELHQLPETEAKVSFSCRHCNITTIGSAVFMDVLNIQRVDLSWNEITGDQLIADIFRGPYSNREYEPIPLEELDLSHNFIHTLEKRVFEHTPHLKKLNLGYNQFDIIDLTTMNAIASVPELTHLDLSYNHLKDLPATLFNPLTQLRSLHIEGNGLTNIPQGFAQLADSLRYLSIASNPLTTITPDSFIGFNKLRHLNMSSMPELKAIESGSFAQLKALEIVDCNGNSKLETFDIESLKQAVNLRQLDISNCNLRKLNADYEFEMPVENKTKYWQNLHRVRLSGNPWHCDCFMAHVLAEIALYNNASKYSIFKARCVSPYELAGTLLDNFTVEKGCPIPAMDTQLFGPFDADTLLQPKAILLIVIATVVIVALAFVIGFGIVMIRRKFAQSNSPFTTPIRYTTVRNSTMSTMSSAVPE